MTSSIISVSVKSGKCFAYPDFHSAVQRGCPGDLILEESQVYPIPDYQALDELQSKLLVVVNILSAEKCWRLD